MSLPKVKDLHDFLETYGNSSLTWRVAISVRKTYDETPERRLWGRSSDASVAVVLAGRG